MIGLLKRIMRRPDNRPEEYSAQVQLLAERQCREARAPLRVTYPKVPLLQRRAGEPPGRSRPVISQ